MICLRFCFLILMVTLSSRGYSQYPLLAPREADSLDQVVKERLEAGLQDKTTIHLLKVLHRAHASKSPTKANEYIEQAMDIAVKINDKVEIATMYNYFGNLHRDLGLYSKALESHLKALEMSRTVANDTMIAFAMNDVGNIYYDMHQWDQALTYYRGAQALSKNIGYLNSHSVSLNNTGLVHEQLGNLDSALYYHQLALKDRQLLKDRDLIAHSNMYLGIDYRNLGLMDDAMEHLGISLEGYQKVGNREMVPALRELIAETYLIIGNRTDAETNFLQAYEEYQGIESHIQQVELGIRLGKFYSEAGALDKALEQVTRAQHISKSQGFLLGDINATQLLADIQQEQGDYGHAYTSLKRYNYLKDSFNNMEFTQKISLIEAQSNISDKERQISAMVHEQELREQALTAKETTNRILYGIIVTVFILAIIILYAFYQKARANRELQGKNKIIEDQNRKIEANNTELQKAKEIAEKYSKAKTEFLSNISHEFRTPMSGIVGLTNILLENQPEGEEKKNLESIRYSAKYLLNILNEVLDLSKIEAGKIDFNTEPFNLPEMVEQLAETHKAKIVKPVMLTYAIDPAVPYWIKGDATRLFQILNNLVDNSLKFTDKGFVRIEIRKTTESEGSCTLEFSVSDTGMGMNKEQMKKVFNRFEQGDAKVYNKYGGTGLGLSITKRLIEMQNGTLHVESELDVGTTFTFELTFEKVEKPMEDTLQEIKKPGIKKGLKILYAEDNEINQFLLRQLFKEEQVELDFAVDGQEAIDKINNNHYDLILMDIQMPNMDGIEATQQIRKMAGKPTVPIIGFTADVMTDTKMMALNAGMDFVMLKPFEKEELMNLIVTYTNS